MMRNLFTLLCALLFGLPSASAQFPEMEKGSPIRIEVQPVFSATPGSVAPYRVTIWNNSARAGEWRLISRADNYRTTFNTSFIDRVTFQVGPRETRTFDVVLQLPSGDRYYNNVLAIEGPGVEGGVGGHSIKQGRHNQAGFAASNDLELSLLATYRDRAAKTPSKYGNTIPTFAPENLIADWRAYIAFRQLVFSEKAWTQQTSAEVRNAIRQWVATGGKLYVLTEAEATPIWEGVSLRKQGAAPVAYGSGEVIRLEEKAADANIDLLSAEQKSGDVASIAPKSPELKNAAVFIMVFTLAFAITIGPVNLFFLAPAHRRQRLFLTIPTISVIGTACLIAFILLKDGLGGSGERYVIIRLMPESHEATVVQHQAATTGMLLGSSFRIEDRDAIMNYSNELKDNFMQEEGRYSGGWFRSRAEQKHRLQTLRSSRMGIERVNRDGPPEIVSSIEGTLQSLVLSDEHGKYWGAENVATGQKTTLHPIEVIERSDTVNLAAYAGTLYGTRLLNDLLPSGSGPGPGLQLRAGAFIAIPADPTPLLIDTLPSIRWSDRAVIAGTYTLSHTPAR